MKHFFSWLWLLITFPPLWFVVAFVGFWFGCERYVWDERTLPQAGVVHRLKSKDNPETSIQLKIPEGWHLQSLRPLGTTERFLFLPPSGNTPYLLVERTQLPPEAYEQAHREAKAKEPHPLMATAEDSVTYYDASRDVAWKVDRGNVTDLAEVTIFSKAVYRLKYFHRPSHRYTLATLEKIVTSIQPLDEDAVETSRSSAAMSNRAASSEFPENRFEMSTAAERLKRAMAPYDRLQVLGVAAGILLVLFLVYFLVRRSEIRQRIEATTRMMSIIKRGRSLRTEYDRINNPKP